MPATQPELDIPADASTPTEIAAIAERDRVREAYLTRLAEKLKDPEFRKIEGFPIGTDEAILALSDPPYYTACPNPFLEEWLCENAPPYDAATDDYHREPFAADVSEGKNDPIYNAHSYHTKVPHKAIMRYILHYTEPGDVVYDGFCGTGMTGVAAQMCGSKDHVESLGYEVHADGAIIDKNGVQFSQLGRRKAILSDLSPAATFIAHNYNVPVDKTAFNLEAKEILAQVKSECDWMYTTLHQATNGEIEKLAKCIRECDTLEKIQVLFANLKSGIKSVGDESSRLSVSEIDYTVWSDVFICPSCGNEMVFWEAAVDEVQGKINDIMTCQHCRTEVAKRQCERSMFTQYDTVISQAVRQSKQVPVFVSYSYDSVHYKRELNAVDYAVIEAVERFSIPMWFPSNLMMGIGENWGDTYRSGYCVGITHSHHFYTKRNLWVLSSYKAKTSNSKIENHLLAVLTGGLLGLTKQQRYRPETTFPNMILSGTIYFGSIMREWNPYEWLGGKLNSLYKSKYQGNAEAVISTQSCTLAAMPDCSVSYAFTDPPFGGNLQYAELNFSWEAWLRVTTATKLEAVTNKKQGKYLPQYQRLMTESFHNYYRILKPGHWMTVVFHNSANAVWNVIQESLERVGFVVADVRTLDKKQQAFNAINASSAVNLDLVISCYKPRTEFELRFQQIKGQTEGVLEFVRQHLSMLPIAPIKGDKLEILAERTRFLLFDRMIAYHLQRSAPIPIDSAAFYKLLEEQFTARDGMYFLPDQAAAYDALKSRGYETEQLSIFMQDEKSAVQWVRTALTERPQTLGYLTPNFMRELHEWPPHEPRPELRDLLREYFVQDGAGLWRVPYPDVEKDIEQLRTNAMLRTFQDYARQKGPLKTFRKEAVVEGFKYCYKTNQHGLIVAICERIPEKIFQEIPEFVMFYDIAKDLVPERIEQIEFIWE